MARRIVVEKDPDPEPRPETPTQPPPWHGMDPRRYVFSHPADWPAEDRQRMADHIREGMRTGQWDGLPRIRRLAWDDFSDDEEKS